MRQRTFVGKAVTALLLSLFTLLLVSCGGSSGVDSESNQHPGGADAYVVTLDTQGGEDWGSISVLAGETLAMAGIESPTKDGFDFLGWSTSADGFVEWDVNTPVTSDMTLYAAWDGDSMGAEYHRLTVHLQGGAIRNVPVQTLDIDFKSGRTLKQLPRMNVAPDHATLAFGGWNTQADGRGDFVRPGDVLTSDMEIYAIYGTLVSTSDEALAIECNNSDVKYVINGYYTTLSDFTPLCGTASNPFKGMLMGDFYTALNPPRFVINNFASTDYAESKGFFGYTDGAVFANIQINAPSSSGITNAKYAGGIAGYMKNTNVWDAFQTGMKTTDVEYAGGITGYGDNVKIMSEPDSTYHYVSASGLTAKYGGAAAGYLQNSYVQGLSTTWVSTIYMASASEDGAYIGGLVGYMKNSSMVDCGDKSQMFVSYTNYSTKFVNSDYENSYVGGLVGFLDNSSIEGSFDNYQTLFAKRVFWLRERVTANRDNSFAGSIAGGMSGTSQIKGAVVSSQASVYGNNSAAGVVGSASGGSISEVLTYGSAYASGTGSYAGGIAGILTGTATVTGNVVLGDKVTGVNGASANAIAGSGTAGSGNYVKKGFLVNSTPYASATELSTIKKNKTFFTDTLGWDFASGLWEMKDHYEYPSLRAEKAPDFVEITTAAQLQAIGDTETTLKGKYFLMNDIDASSITEPIGTGVTSYGAVFSGELDGNGHKITGIDIMADKSGLFKTGLSFAYIHDLTLENVNIGTLNGDADRVYAGGVATAAENSLIERVHVSGTINGGGYVGGLFANFSGLISDSSFYGGTVMSDVTSRAESSAAGIAAELMYGQIRRSYSAGNITVIYNGTSTSSRVYAGGIIGENGYATSNYSAGASVDSCYSTANVTATDEITTRGVFAGGIVGKAEDLSVTNCYATGNVTGIGNSTTNTRYDYRVSTGGIVGWLYGTGSDYVTGNVAMMSAIDAHQTDNTPITDFTARIVGAASESGSANAHALTVKSSGNYAVASLALGGSTRGDEGTDVSAADQSFFETTLGWNFADVWKWDTTNNRPVFQWQ